MNTLNKMSTLPTCPSCKNQILINHYLPPGDSASLGCCGKSYHICPDYPGTKFVEMDGKRFAIGMPDPGSCAYCKNIYKKEKPKTYKRKTDGCPWCGNPNLMFVRDGGSSSCFSCMGK